MTILRADDLSVSVTAFFMRMIGLWYADNLKERCLRFVGVLCTLWAFSYGMFLEVTDMYNVRDDLQNLLFDMCNILSVIVPMCKYLILLLRREKLLRLILYVIQNFLNADYDESELLILSNCKRKCMFFVCIFISFTEVTVISYLGAPLIINLGKNETERVLPFKMWVNLPMQETPYFETAYVAEVLCVYIIGRTYFSVDNVLCIITLHVAGQFRILQYRLSNKYSGLVGNKTDEKSKEILDLANNASAVFKDYVKQHQALIEFCAQIEGVYSLVVLVQVLAFSLFICLDGFQMLLAELVQRKVTFVFHFMATVSQLVMFSYSCDCIIRESEKLATAACSGPWQNLPATKSVANVKKDMIMLVMRSNVPCCLTGRGFFVVSLETCTRVLTTAGSYFTLLQETQKDSDP